VEYQGTGIVRWWVDGVLQGDGRNVSWLNGTGFAALHIDPIWGGTGDAKLKNDFFMYDHVYVSKR
jgi:hypothetical protein